jgi:hypothetical protein
MKGNYRNMNTTRSKQQVLTDYQANQKTTNEIARESHVSTATITVWAKHAGLPLRGRGRWRMNEPSLRNKAILELAQTSTCAAAGRRFGISRQCAWRIVKRWKPLVCPLTDADLTGDIERLIIRTVTPYVDPSHPMLNLDELQAECRAKLAKIIHSGRLARCPTRGKVFAFVKASFRNHVSSLVKKYAFTAKRTGVKPPPRLPLGASSVTTARKVQVISLDDPDIGHQVGCDDERFRQAEFIEELFARLSAPECAELEALMGHGENGGPGNGNSCKVDELPSKAERKARRELLHKCRAILMALPDEPSNVNMVENTGGNHGAK